MRIVFIQELNETAVAYFKEKLPGHDLVFPQTEDEARLAHAARGADVVVGYKLPRAVLDAAPGIKAFLTGAAGVHPSVLEAVAHRPTLAAANSHANALDVAEHALALALDASKLISRGDREMRRGDWSLRYNDVPGRLVTGKTAAIVGYGAIGRALAELVQGFHWRLIGVRSTRAGGGPDPFGVIPVGPEDLKASLAAADFVFVFAPLTPKTRGLVGSAELGAMKKDSVLVHVSRGPVVDEKALFEALKEKRIGAAALDVWYVYPLAAHEYLQKWPGHFPFQELENLVMSPHRASYTERMHREQWDDVVENIRRVEAGEPLFSPISVEAGY